MLRSSSVSRAPRARADHREDKNDEVPGSWVTNLAAYGTWCMLRSTRSLPMVDLDRSNAIGPELLKEDTMSAGLKAGLVGAAAAVLLSLLLPVPRVVWIAIAPSVVLYVTVGILAAYWAESPRDVGKGASAGAVAGLVTGLAHGLLYGLIPMIINVVRFIERGLWAALPRQFHQLLPGSVAGW